MDLIGVFTETQVRHGNTAGLLGVIIKVCLSVHIGVVTDDLDGVLVCTYGTVSAQTPELTVDGAFRSGNQRCAQLPETGCVTSSFDTDGELLASQCCCIQQRSEPVWYPWNQGRNVR